VGLALRHMDPAQRAAAAAAGAAVERPPSGRDRLPPQLREVDPRLMQTIFKRRGEEKPLRPTVPDGESIKRLLPQHMGKLKPITPRQPADQGQGE
jgi:hypothetical protein